MTSVCAGSLWLCVCACVQPVSRQTRQQACSLPREPAKRPLLIACSCTWGGVLVDAHSAEAGWCVAAALISHTVCDNKRMQSALRHFLTPIRGLLRPSCSGAIGQQPWGVNTCGRFTPELAPCMPATHWCYYERLICSGAGSDVLHNPLDSKQAVAVDSCWVRDLPLRTGTAPCVRVCLQSWFGGHTSAAHDLITCTAFI